MSGGSDDFSKTTVEQTVNLCQYMRKSFVLTAVGSGTLGEIFVDHDFLEYMRKSFVLTAVGRGTLGEIFVDHDFLESVVRGIRHLIEKDETKQSEHFFENVKSAGYGEYKTLI
eukprot:scaffold2249_cov201-Alexandrium_tamarense.AAC.1